MIFSLFFTRSHGHVNACLGLARMLRDFGHECIFIVLKPWIPLVEGHKFKIEIITDPTIKDDQDPQEKWGYLVREMAHFFTLSPLERMAQTIEKDTQEWIEYVQRIDGQVTEIIEKVDPSIIIMDFYVTVPSIVKSGKPWLVLYSANPLSAYEKPEVPPAHSGLSAKDDPKLFDEFRAVRYKHQKNVKAKFDRYLKEHGIEPDARRVITYSPYLNLYSYPEELDYQEFAPVPEKWFRLDHMVRKVDDGPLGFDSSFFETKEKLIFFTLGSMGSSDVDLMKRLLQILAKSKHKFIVSKGPFHNEIELPANMTGGKYLNQMKILPRVDLVIHHGGNNSFVETLYFGKPCIILPLFGDQLDNGLRAVEKGIGKSFNPYRVTEEELLEAIDEILENQDLIEKVFKIGERMRNSKSHVLLNQKLEQIVKTTK